jgi:hypothetical protein
MCVAETNIDGTFPDIVMIVGGSSSVELILKGSNYMKIENVGRALTCVSSFRADPSLDNANYWIMGIPAYNSFAVLHDLSNQQMGFASQGKAQVLQAVPEGLGALSLTAAAWMIVLLQLLSNL